MAADRLADGVGSGVGAPRAHEREQQVVSVVVDVAEEDEVHAEEADVGDRGEDGCDIERCRLFFTAGDCDESDEAARAEEHELRCFEVVVGGDGETVERLADLAVDLTLGGLERL